MIESHIEDISRLHRWCFSYTRIRDVIGHYTDCEPTSCTRHNKLPSTCVIHDAQQRRHRLACPFSDVVVVLPRFTIYEVFLRYALHLRLMLFSNFLFLHLHFSEHFRFNVRNIISYFCIFVSINSATIGFNAESCLYIYQ